MKIYVRADSSDYINIDNKMFDPNVGVRKDIARQTKSPELLEIYAYDPDWRVRLQAAWNSYTPADTLFTLALDDDWHVATAAYENVNFPHSEDRAVAEQVTESRGGNMLARALIKDHKTDEDMLRILVPKAPYWTLEWLAKLARTPVSILGMLAKHPMKQVRKALLKNKRLPDSILAELQDDPELGREVAKLRGKVSSDKLVELSNADNPKIRAEACANPDLPYDVLLQHVKDKNCQVRAAVARSPRIPANILVQMANDRSYMVRAAVARNENTPNETRITFLDDADRWVRAQVLYTKAPLSIDIYNKVLENSDDFAYYLIARENTYHDVPDNVLLDLGRKIRFSGYYRDMVRHIINARGLNTEV